MTFYFRRRGVRYSSCKARSPHTEIWLPGTTGEDVRQLEQALERLGLDPGRIDGVYDQQTAAAVAKWYKSKGWDPFGPTRDQLANVRTLEREWGDAMRSRVAAQMAAATAAQSTAAARATAEQSNLAAALRARPRPTSGVG